MIMSGLCSDGAGLDRPQYQRCQILDPGSEVPSEVQKTVEPLLLHGLFK